MVPSLPLGLEARGASGSLSSAVKAAGAETTAAAAGRLHRPGAVLRAASRSPGEALGAPAPALKSQTAAEDDDCVEAAWQFQNGC